MSVLVLASACRDDSLFLCADDEECREGGVIGVCEVNSLCSFPDDACGSGRAYGGHAGTLAGECVDEDDLVTTTMTSVSTTGGGEGMTSTSGVTTVPLTSGPSPDDSTSTGGSSDTDLPTSGDAPTTDGGPTGDPNGSSCQGDADCASDACYVTPLGSWCGECTSDADCRHGCSPPHPLNAREVFSMCNDGQLGAPCESDQACADASLSCISFANIGGILSIWTCSECGSTADCPGAQVCNEFFNANNLTGGFACTNPGSLVDGAFCTTGATGEAACMNHCAPGTYMGLFNFGVCSECADDSQCPPGQTCSAPTIDVVTGGATTAQCT